MKLKSEDFEENGFIPSRFACDGEDVSPRLYWDDVPEDAKSFALSMTDPDAPGGMFIHWLIYNMPKGIRRIERGGLPAGARQVMNDFGRERYVLLDPRQVVARPADSTQTLKFFSLFAFG